MVQVLKLVLNRRHVSVPEYRISPWTTGFRKISIGVVKGRRKNHLFITTRIAGVKISASVSQPFLKKVLEVRTDKKTTVNPMVRPVFRPSTALPHQNHHAVNSSWCSESALSSQWRNILKRSKIPYRTIYQTRHTFACWQLTAHGNIAFIADQMTHTDYSMLVKRYGRWMKTESQNEVNRIWNTLESKGHFLDQNAPMMPQKSTNTT